MNKTNKINLLKIIEYLMAIIMILDCNSAYTRIVNHYFYITEIGIIITLIFFICIIVDSKKLKVRSIFYLLLIVSSFLFFLLLNVRISIVVYIVKYLIFLPALLLFMQKEKKYKDFMKIITNTTCIVAIISLFFYIFGSTMHLIPNQNILINWGGINLQKNYMFLHFDTQVETVFGMNITRNSGIFTEAPMYSCILLFSLIIELLFERRNKKHIIIFIIAIFSTLSLVGICLTMILLFLDFLSTKDIKFIYKFITIPILLIVVTVAIDYLVNNKMKNNQNSYSARMDDYKASYEAWLDNPIMGKGYEDTSATVSHMLAKRRNNPGQSNAIGRYFSEGGLYFSLLVFVPYLLLVGKSLIQKKYRYFIYTVGMIFSVCTINVPYQLFTILMLAICYKYLLENKKEKVE